MGSYTLKSPKLWRPLEGGHSEIASTRASRQALCFSLDLLSDEIRAHSVAREQLDIALTTTHRAAELSRHLLSPSGADAAAPEPEIKA
jgi:hypothetical protein